MEPANETIVRTADLHPSGGASPGLNGKRPLPRVKTGWAELDPADERKRADGEARSEPKANEANWWAHQDLNLGPCGYEPRALTN